LELGRYSNRYFAPESLLFPMKDKEHFPVLSFLFGYFGRLLTRASSSPLLSCVRAPPPRDFTQSHVSHGGTLDTPMGRDRASKSSGCSSPLTSALAVAKLGRVSFLPEIYLSIYRPPDPLCQKKSASSDYSRIVVRASGGRSRVPWSSPRSRCCGAWDAQAAL
jgi:hypothetical protein